MSLLLIKLVLTPLLIAAATLTARRWGPAVGGWLAGLPLTSAPVSVYLALEQGRAFTAQAARASLLGLVGVAVFCVAYSRNARGKAWLPAETVGVGMCVLATWGLSFLSTGLLVTAALVFGLIAAAIIAVGHPGASAAPPRAAWWDLPLRMATATAMVLVITGSAATLGPKWSGLLSPFPVFTSVMAVFAQSQSGAAAAQLVLRGVAISALSAATFFLIVGLLVGSASLLLVYALATGAALLVNGLLLFTIVRK